jgi:hypothetical protein
MIERVNIDGTYDLSDNAGKPLSKVNEEGLIIAAVPDWPEWGGGGGRRKFCRNDL